MLIIYVNSYLSFNVQDNQFIICNLVNLLKELVICNKCEEATIVVENLAALLTF